MIGHDAGREHDPVSTHGRPRRCRDRGAAVGRLHDELVEGRIIVDVDVGGEHGGELGQSRRPGAPELVHQTSINKVRPSVVEITTDTGLGSGVVYDTKGNIVTNDHVVRGATTFQVSLFDGKNAPSQAGG